MRITAMALALAAGLLVAPESARAQEHLVSPEIVDARLVQSTAQRGRDVAVLDAALDGPVAARAAATIGADLDGVRRAIPALSDADLRDLAQRAQALSADPAAGLDHDVEQLLVVFLIVAIVILVIQAVD